MKRIWVDEQGLSRTRIAPGPLPLHETFISLCQHVCGTSSRPRRRTRDGLPARAAPLLELVHARGFPDFLTPTHHAEDLESALDTLLSAQTKQMHDDLDLIARNRPLSPWLRRLAVGDREAQQVLETAIRDYHDHAHIADHLARHEPATRAHTTQRMLLTGARGLETGLNHLHPLIRWQTPALEIDTGGDTDLDFHTRDGGLLLIPSILATVPLIGTQNGHVVLTYPAAPDTETTPAPPVTDPLSALLGRTRAAVLRAAQPGATTTDLAHRAHVSLATASEHATILRNAGLLVTIRTGMTVHHTLTPLGHDLLTN